MTFVISKSKLYTFSVASLIFRRDYNSYRKEQNGHFDNYPFAG